jgi:putative ABC transport system permease protein
MSAPWRQWSTNAVRRQRISAVLLSAFAVGALLLAAMGLFGIVAGSVTRRRHELALRLAVGADHGRLVRLVLGEGTALVLVGVLIGLPASNRRRITPGRAGRHIAARSAHARQRCPWARLVTMVACYLPARRVLRINPAQSLRQE